MPETDTRLRSFSYYIRPEVDKEVHELADTLHITRSMLAEFCLKAACLHTRSELNKQTARLTREHPYWSAETLLNQAILLMQGVVLASCPPTPEGQYDAEDLPW